MKTSQKKLEIETTKLAEFRQKLFDVETDLECAKVLPPAVSQRAAAMLEGRPTDDEEIFDLDALEREHDTLTEAVRLQGLRVDDARRLYGAEVYESRKNDHDKLVGSICDAIESLHTALRAEANFAQEIRQFGGGPRSLNFSAHPLLKLLRTEGADVFRHAQKNRGFNLEIPVCHRLRKGDIS